MTELPNQQTPYAFVLALSVALFLHVTLATLVNAWLDLPAPNKPAPTVRVRIAPSGNPDRAAPSQSTSPSRPKKQEAASEGQPEAGTPDADATTIGQTQRRPEPGPASISETTSSKENRTAPEQTPENTPSAEKTSSAENNPSVTQLSRNDKQKRSDYEIKLWERVAQAVEYTPVLAKLERPSEIVLELRLMSNGALRRARVGKSSGTQELDAVAREAALAATPFPEPPEGRRRFRVRLIFEPARRE